MRSPSLRASLAQYPGMNRFVLDWMAGEQRATQLLPRDVHRARRTGRTISEDLARAIAASNRRWGLDVDGAVAQWQTGETYTLIAGQQVGFAGGPLYTLAKIASLVRIKRQLEAGGQPATVLFWLATEDHDFDEVATLNLPVALLPAGKEANRQRDLLCIRAARSGDVRAAVGSLPLPETLAQELLSLFDRERPAWLRKGISFRDSFAELIAEAFGPEVILVDALLPELRRAGEPLFEKIAANRTAMQQALARRSDALAAAGYNEQVIARDGDEYTLLFQLDARGVRHPLTSDAPLALEHPERISTSALTRPLLQDFVLQPDLFLGGPAEVAYYAQLAPLHELLGIELPRVGLRGHLLVARHRILRAMTKYSVAPADVFNGADELLVAREPEGVARIRELANGARQQLLAAIEEIGDLALPADHSLAGSIAKSTGHLEYHFEKFSARAVKALVRKNRERHHALRDVVAALYPDRHVQDRVVSWVAYWWLAGDVLIERMIEEIEPDAPFFKVVSI